MSFLQTFSYLFLLGSRCYMCCLLNEQLPFDKFEYLINETT